MAKWPPSTGPCQNLARTDCVVKVVKRNKVRRYVGVNDRGYAIGENHARAKLSDKDIELILELREAGLSYGEISKKFDDGVTVSKGHVRDICNGRRRAQVPTDWRLREMAPRSVPEHLAPRALAEHLFGGAVEEPEAAPAPCA